MNKQAGGRWGTPSIGLSGGTPSIGLTPLPVLEVLPKPTLTLFLKKPFPILARKNFLDEVAELKVSKLFGILSFTLI